MTISIIRIALVNFETGWFRIPPLFAIIVNDTLTEITTRGYVC